MERYNTQHAEIIVISRGFWIVTLVLCHERIILVGRPI